MREGGGVKLVAEVHDGASSQPPIERGGMQPAGWTPEGRVHFWMVEPPEEVASCHREGENIITGRDRMALDNKCNLKPLPIQADIKQNQQRLIDQLLTILTGSPGPPTRWLFAHCLAQVYHHGDPVPSTIFVERCNDIIRSKDDSPSGLPTRL